MRLLTNFLFIIVILNGCISWYTNQPLIDQNITIEKINFSRLHYSVEFSQKFAYGNSSYSTIDPEIKNAVVDSLKNSSLFEFYIEHDNLKKYLKEEKGNSPFFLQIKVSEGFVSVGQIVWGYFSMIFLEIIPHYYSSVYNVEFHLYKYSALHKTYKKMDTVAYTPKKRGYGWILNLPFLWVNFITNDEEDIARLATKGYMQKMSTISTIRRAQYPAD